MSLTTLCGIYFQSVRPKLISPNKNVNVRESVENNFPITSLVGSLYCSTFKNKPIESYTPVPKTTTES